MANTLLRAVWEITNCENSNEKYLIQFEQNQTDIYLYNVYRLSGSELLINKCFRISNYFSEGLPVITNVIIEVNYGKDACRECLYSLKFVSCLDPAAFLYVQLRLDVIVTLTVGSVYELSVGEGCYKYVGQLRERLPDHYNVVILSDYKTMNCDICSDTFLFKGCASEIVIEVSFAEGVILPTSADNLTLYKLQGNGIIDDCWRYIGKGSGSLPVTRNCTIIEHINCTDCIACISFYKLYNCDNPEEIINILWDSAIPLLQGYSFVFDFAPTTCFTAVKQNRLCNESGEEIPDAEYTYGPENILYSFENGCKECNALCYKLINCAGELDYPTIYTPENFSIYVNHIIKWEDPNGIIRCASVEAFKCITEDLPLIIPIVLDCFNTCLECNPPIPPKEDFTFTPRPVIPGHNVPECSTGNSCCGTNSSCQNTTPCNSCLNN